MTKDALGELLAQKEALEKQIAELQRQQRSEAIGKVRALMAEYGLSLADLGSPSNAAAARRSGKVAAKFRDPATGSSWSGRGLQPKWLKTALASGRPLSDFTL